jgi:hypothetical protein
MARKFFIFGKIMNRNKFSIYIKAIKRGNAMILKIKWFRKSNLISCLFIVGFSTAMVSCITDDEEGAELERTEPVEDEPMAEAASAPGAGTEETKPVDAAPLSPQSPQVSPVATPPAPSSEQQAQSTLNSAGSHRRVMYVKQNGTSVRATADKAGKVIAKLNKGDHLLVNIEGEWARTDEGKFISIEDLSEKGIGRGVRQAPKWSGSQSKTSKKTKENKSQK